MIYIKSLFACVVLASIVVAQIPNFGRCPDYDAMRDFDREGFLGKWYEIERYFAVSELASRCVSVMYERRADGKIYVNNEMTNRFTNVQRIVSGVLNQTAKSDIATFTVRYTGLPVSYDTTLHVLDTDYDSYAVVWSCNSLAGPVGHTESVWILARERIPDGPVLQTAYGILDKYKISRTFFVKTDQTECETEGEPDEAIDGPDTGYDIVVDDDEGSVNNQYGHENPQIHQVQHIAHVENLQQFSPAYPVQPVYRPNVHNHGLTQGYFKQKDTPVEKSAVNASETKQQLADTKPTGDKPTAKTSIDIKETESNVNEIKEETRITGNKISESEKIESKTEQPEKAETPKLPSPMEKVLAVDTNATASATATA